MDPEPHNSELALQTVISLGLREPEVVAQGGPLRWIEPSRQAGQWRTSSSRSRFPLILTNKGIDTIGCGHRTKNFRLFLRRWQGILMAINRSERRILVKYEGFTNLGAQNRAHSTQCATR